MGSAPSEQTITNKTELPAWLEDVTKSNLAKAQDVASMPYTPYGGSMTAALSPLQQQYMQTAQDTAGQRAGQYDQAGGMATAAGGYNPQEVSYQAFPQGDVSAYMNPYIEQVEAGALRNANSQLQQGLNTLGDRAVKASAFGGSRQGISEGLATSEAAKNMGDLSGQLRMHGYTQAQTAMMTDSQRQLQAQMANQQAGLTQNALSLQAAKSLSDITGQGAASNALDLSQLQQAGALERGQQQSLLDEAYAKWAEASPKQQEINNLNLLLAATSSTPYGNTTTQTKTGGGSSNDLMQGLGAAASIASIIGAL
jgi:hypothetical protein